MDAEPVRLDIPAPAVPSVAFTGRRGRVFLIVLKNVLLTVVTLGIYRFWAKTAVRRYFWSNTRIADEPFEYTGRGLELFIGFLIVLAVLVPLGIVTGLAQDLARVALPWMAPVLSVVNVLVILFLIQLAVFRMTRYRLTRTRWRGIRFGLDGKPLHYAVRGFLWLLSLVPSLGLTAPFMTVDLARYRIERMRFGGTHFTFEGSGRKLFWPWVIQGVPLATAAAIALAFPFYLMADAPEGVVSTNVHVTYNRVAIFWLMGGSVAAFAIGGVLHVWYKVREFRYLAGCIGFGETRFDSRLPLVRVFLLALATALLYLLLIGAMAGTFAGIVSSLEGTDSLAANQRLAVQAAFVAVPAVFAFFLLVSPFIKTVFWRVAMTHAVCRTLTISDLTPFEQAAQAASDDPRFGEGLADAFDVDAF